ncbi:retrovirus-related pol polyprotein from transposon TNT 1-94 [Tanacetum coccineum]
MDLCGPMRIESINGEKYILVIVDDYSRFTWVKLLRSNDETLEFIIKFIKQVQVYLNAIGRNIITDNGTEFVNQTLQSYYEDVGISHQTSVARTLQQNGIVKTAKLDFRKLKTKADTDIFIGYSPAKKAYRIYNKRTRLIMETIHVEFDEDPPSTIISRMPPTVALIPADITGTPLSTIIDQDAPSTSTSPTTHVILSPVIHQGVEEPLQGIETAQFDNDPFHNIFTPEPSSE